MDDLLLFSHDEKEHIKTLEKLLQRLHDNGLSLSLDKCHFGASEVEFVGYKVNKNGILPLQKKVEAIN